MTNLEAFERDVDRMIGSGVPFEEIEQYIEELPLNDDRKSALWLIAWAYEPPRRRSDILRMN